MHCKSIFLTSIKIYARFESYNLFTFHAKRYATSRNPYDVLGLKHTCSAQDIKNAYIKKCKELHPDVKPGDSSQHMKFIELHSAYSALVHVKSRQRVNGKSSDHTYHDDMRMNYRKASGPFAYGTWTQHKQWYEQEDYQQFYQKQRKASLKPVKHIYVVLGCFLLIIIGSILYYSAYSYATRDKLKMVDEKSRKISEKYQDARKSALESGKEEQIQNLKKRWKI